MICFYMEDRLKNHTDAPAWRKNYEINRRIPTGIKEIILAYLIQRAGIIKKCAFAV